MNAATPEQMARMARADIEQRLNMREVTLSAFRNRLRCFIRQSGPLRAKEAQDMVCCIAELLGDDLREVKASLTDVSIDLEGIDHFEDSDE
jgi:hypothetical protein